MAKFKVGDVTVHRGADEDNFIPLTERTVTAVGTKNYLYTTNTDWDGDTEYNCEQSYADREWELKPERVPKKGDTWKGIYNGSSYRVKAVADGYVVAAYVGTFTGGETSPDLYTMAKFLQGWKFVEESSE